MGWEPSKPQPNPIKLNEYELKELRIIKQAVLKSALEGGAIAERTLEAEEFLENWIKWVFREEEKDFNLVKKQALPF